MLTPDQKGSIAETAIAALAVRHGVTVLKPLCEGTRYDLVFAEGRAFLRVQCKWASRRGDVLVVNCRTSRRVAGGRAISRTILRCRFALARRGTTNVWA